MWFIFYRWNILLASLSIEVNFFCEITILRKNISKRVIMSICSSWFTEPNQLFSLLPYNYHSSFLTTKFSSLHNWFWNYEMTISCKRCFVLILRYDFKISFFHHVDVKRTFVLNHFDLKEEPVQFVLVT